MSDNRESIMDTETYRIKPLEWKKISPPHGIPELCEARTIFGSIQVWQWASGECRIGEMPRGDFFKECNSISHGKQLAEAHYRSRLLSALEKVEEKP